MTVEEIEQVLTIHVLDPHRDGSGRGVCGPFPCDAPMCGWEGHHSAHARHVAEIIAETRDA